MRNGEVIHPKPSYLTPTWLNPISLSLSLPRTKAILRYPPTQALGSEEKDLLWKFRFYLTRDKKALTKYLKCVVWTDPNDARQAVDLLPEWDHPDVDDALELLGPFFRHREVRAYAVAQLERAGDEVGTH